MNLAHSPPLLPIFLNIIDRISRERLNPLCTCLFSGEYCESISAVQILLNSTFNAGFRQKYTINDFSSFCSIIQSSPCFDQLKDEKIYIDSRSNINIENAIKDYLNNELLPPYIYLDKFVDPTRRKELINIAFCQNIHKIPKSNRKLYFKTISQLMVLWVNICNKNIESFEALIQNTSKGAHEDTMNNDKHSLYNTEQNQHMIDWDRSYKALSDFSHDLENNLPESIDDSFSYNLLSINGLGKELHRIIIKSPFVNFSYKNYHRADKLCKHMVSFYTTLNSKIKSYNTKLSYLIGEVFLSDWLNNKNDLYFHALYNDKKLNSLNY